VNLRSTVTNEPPARPTDLPHDHGGPGWWDDLSVRPARAESEAWPAVGVVVALTASNVMTNRVLPRWAYVPWNVGVATGLVWWAQATGGCSGAELGLARRHLLGGLRWGAGAAAAVGAFYAAGAAIPGTRKAFRDDRADRVGVGELAWRVLIEIPLGTALTEEVAFRGVLPASALADSNPKLQELPTTTARLAAVASSVTGTTAAGLAFTWLRNRSGSVLAPVLLHGAINSGAYTIAWLIGREWAEAEGPRPWRWDRPVRRAVRGRLFRRRVTDA